jgi:hypothetical protein
MTGAIGRYTPLPPKYPEITPKIPAHGQVSWPLARNMETVLQQFADDALVVSSSGRLMRGCDQIRSWVQDQVERSPREEAGP